MEPKTLRRRSIQSYGGLNTVYKDQNPLNGAFIQAAYTPEWIRKMDSDYAKRIQNGENLLQLAKEIAKNKHLHYVIRRNLLDNIKIYENL